MSFDKKRFFILLRFFLFFFVLFFFLFNWSRISFLFDLNFWRYWLFPSNELEKDFSKDFLLSKNDLNFCFLEIPQISVFKKVLKAENESQSRELLKKGLIFHPLSDFKAGRLYILGHSAPLNWPRFTKEAYPFSFLKNLKEGDVFYLWCNTKKFSFRVEKVKILEKDTESFPLTNQKNIVLLISCWPPGKDIKRVVVFASLIKDK